MNCVICVGQIRVVNVKETKTAPYLDKQRMIILNCGQYLRQNIILLTTLMISMFLNTMNHRHLGPLRDYFFFIFF